MMLSWRSSLMRKLALALVLLPGAAFAQSTTLPAPALDLRNAVGSPLSMQVISIKDRHGSVAGARCDGSSDDRAAINAALSAASTGNVKTVFFPPSATACMMASNVAVPAGVTLWAYPGTVTVKVKTGNVSSPLLFEIANVSNVAVSGLTLDGGGADFGSTNNVNTVFTASNIVFSHVTVQNTRGIGLVFSTSISKSGVRDSVFTNVGNHWKTTALTADRIQAVAFCCGTIANNFGNFITGTLFNDIGLDAISAASQHDFLASSNRCLMGNGQGTQIWINPQPNAFGSCIYIASSNQANMVNNVIDSAPGNGIDAAAIGERVIVGNFITGSGGDGIGVYNSGNAVIVGNLTKNNAQWPAASVNGSAGIKLADALGRITMAGNISYDDQVVKTQQYGIHGRSLTFTTMSIDASNLFTGNGTADFGGDITGYTGTGVTITLGTTAATDGAPSGVGGAPLRNLVIDGTNSNAAPVSISAMEFHTGRNSAGALLAGQTTADLAWEYGGANGGFRHYLETRHDTSPRNNTIRDYINTQATAGGSSAPGTGNVAVFAQDGAAHLRVGSGTAPALTSCGTSPAIVGTDLAGEVTMGTGSPTGCIITFDQAYSGAPYCTVTWQANLAAMGYTISPTALTLTQTAASSNKVDYTCIARTAG